MTVTAINKKNKKQEPVEPVKVAAPMEITQEQAESDAFHRIMAAAQKVEDARVKLILAGQNLAAAKKAHTKAQEEQQQIIRGCNEKLPLIEMMERQVIIDRLTSMNRHAAQYAVNLLLEGQDVAGIASASEQVCNILADNWQVLAKHFGLPTAEPGEAITYYDDDGDERTESQAPEIVTTQYWQLKDYLAKRFSGDTIYAHLPKTGEFVQVGKAMAEISCAGVPEINEISFEDYQLYSKNGPIACVELYGNVKGLGSELLVRWNADMQTIETLNSEIVKILPAADDEEEAE